MKPDHTDRIGTVLLAAGASQRMGRPKQLLKYQGLSMVRRMAGMALELNAGPVVVVVGADADRIADEVDDLPLEVIYNAEWEMGMGTSVAAGVAAIANGTPQPVAALFMVVDQPHVNLLLLRSLLENYRRHHPPVVASSYNDTLGVPAIFDHALFEDLAHLEGNQGARAIIEKYRSVLRSVPFPGGRFDLDTPEDYRLLLGE